MWHCGGSLYKVDSGWCDRADRKRSSDKFQVNTINDELAFDLAKRGEREADTFCGVDIILFWSSLGG